MEAEGDRAIAKEALEAPANKKQMPENWKTYKLGEITSVITKGTTPSTYGFGFEDSGINYIKAESLNYSGDVDENAFVFISEEAHERLKRSQLQPNDILFSMAGAYLGKVGLVKESYCPANTNQAVGIIRINNSNMNVKFVQYTLRNPSMVAYVNAQSGQSAQPNINLSEIGALSFKAPPLPEQHAITSILSALDDKIENNLAMNTTLEAMAMALYKHWFVDFGPFQDGNFIDSELGLIPEGWEVKGLDKIVQISNKTYKPQNHPDCSFLHYSLPAFDESKLPINELGSEIKSTKTLLKKNSILVSKLNPRFPRIWTVFFEESKIISFTSTEFLNYHVKKEHDWGFANCLLRNEQFYSQFRKNATGSTGSRQRVRPAQTLKFILALPLEKLRDDFNVLVSPYFKTIHENIQENRDLAQLRDTLLPKLISGQVRVKDIEKTVNGFYE